MPEKVSLNLEVLPFEAELQVATLKLCLEDVGFLNSCVNYVKDTYFDNSYLGWIFKFIQDFYKQYSTVPSIDTIRNELLKFNPEDRVPYELLLNKITESKFKEFQYLKNELTTWTKKKFLYSKMQKFADMFAEKKNEEEAYKYMSSFANELMNINYDKTGLYDFDLLESVLDYARNSHKYRIRLGIDPFDELLLGGISRQNVTLFIGPMHSGKSMILINLARNIIQQGYKVLYFDLENDLRQLLLRFMASFSTVSYEKFFKVDGLKQDELERLSYSKNLLKNSLMLKSITEFNVYIENLITEAKEYYLQNKFDAIILDYSQIIKIKNFQKLQKHDYLQEIMRGLSCLARDLDVAVITAAQGNRSGQIKAQKSIKKDDTLDITDIADSFGITRVANPIITITKSDKDDEKKRIRLKLAKNRDGKVNQVVSCETDFNTCRIFAEDLNCRIIDNEQDEQDIEADKIMKEYDLD